MNKLDQLRTMTEVVADTGDLDAIRRYRPTDATTNPSLLLKVADAPAYRAHIDDALAFGRERGGSAEEQVRTCIERLSVHIGREILALIPGRVSTEVSARHSFDRKATVDQALRLIGHYNEQGIDNDRVLIKIAATWEGIKAAEELEKRGIHCNMTLLFNFIQARACADAGVTLVSPFVGRIYDWYREKTGENYTPENDPGVRSVTRIFNYYKSNGYDTVVMGASFRTQGQIEALAGCDRLTISPQLLESLAADEGPLSQQLDPSRAEAPAEPALDEAVFRWQLNADAMAGEKLAEGIRKFHDDEIKLEELVARL